MAGISDKGFYLLIPGILLLIAACLPLAQRVDQAVDRKKPMYTDLRTLEWLQFQAIETTGRAVPVTLSPDEAAEFAGQAFSPSRGVTVEVRAPEVDIYCIQVTNQYGDVSDWHCLDEDSPPTAP